MKSIVDKERHCKEFQDQDFVEPLLKCFENEDYSLNWGMVRLQKEDSSDGAGVFEADKSVALNEAVISSLHLPFICRLSFK